MRFIKSEIYFPIIVGLHLILWWIDLALFEGSWALFEGESSTQRVIGEIMSSWVVTVFGFNLLMTTRLKWVERLFGGLDKMYTIHRRSGTIAAVLLLLHFGTVPRGPDFTIGKPLGFAAMAVILLGIMFAAAPMMKRKIPYHKWLGGHRLMGIFYVVGIAHALLVPTLISQLPLVRVYVFGMAALGCGAWFYTAIVSRFSRKPAHYSITRVEQFGKGVVDLRMKPKAGGLKHNAGQFAFFAFAAHAPHESHPFTIASEPDSDELRIVVKASGDFTSALVDNVEVGEDVRVEGPYGHLQQRHFAGSEQIWVAGGIGITPFLSLARALKKDKTAKLFWSVRTEAEAHFEAELAALSENTPNFEYEVWDSHERGYLSANDLEDGSNLSTKDVVICGPVALRDSLIKQLKSKGLPTSQIHFEEFGFR